MRALGIVLSFVLITGCDETRGSGGDPRPSGGTGNSTVADAGPSDAGPSDTGGMVTDAMVADTGMMQALIPVPPMTAANEWPDVEPNDTPAQAVPVGMLQFAFWMGFGMPLNMFSSNTDVDYYVFRTGDAASLTNVLLQICWGADMGGGRVDLLNAYIYEVNNGVQGQAVVTAEDTDTSCENMVSGDASMIMAANSIYLLEVRPPAGADISNHTGMYGA